MPLYKLKWNKVDLAQSYDVFMSSGPGEAYLKIGSAPQSDEPEFDVSVDMVPWNLNLGVSEGRMVVSWEEPRVVGAPMTFKVVPVAQDGTPFFTPMPDLAWMNDEIPIGASWIDQNGFLLSSYRKHGLSSLKISASDGYVEPGFAGATTLMADSYIILWVYVHDTEVPDCVWFSFYDGSSWEHRAFWGKNLCPHGELGSASRRYMEELPTPGTWTPLIIHTRDIEAEHVNGVRFGVYKKQGTGTIYVDSIYYTDQPVMKLPFPHIGLRDENTYGIYRDDKLISFSSGLSYNDVEAIDKRGYSTSGIAPVYTFEFDELSDALRISWGVPEGTGTQYNYKIVSFDNNGLPSSPAERTASISSDYSRTEITISSANTPEYTVSTTGSVYIQESPIRGETYHYVFRTFDSYNNVTSTTSLEYTVPYGSVLDSFILDYSILA